MRGRVRILGKSFPAWVVAMAVIVASSGGAVGVVLAGNVTGPIGATVSQALIVFDGSLVVPVAADVALFTKKDDGTAFTATAEINTGDQFDVKLQLSNGSGAELTGELTLVAVDGITLKVVKGTLSDIVLDVVRTGPFTWKFRLNPDLTGPNTTTDLVITVALADDMPPGFYSVDATLKQVAF